MCFNRRVLKYTSLNNFIKSQKWSSIHQISYKIICSFIIFTNNSKQHTFIFYYFNVIKTSQLQIQSLLNPYTPHHYRIDSLGPTIFTLTLHRSIGFLAWRLFPYMGLSSNNISFPFRISIPVMYGLGLSFERYRVSSVGAYLSFDSQVSTSSTSINVTISPINTGASICYITYCLMIITQPSNSLQIINQDITFQVLNNNSRAASDNTQSFTLTSTKFKFPITRLSLAPFLTYLVTNNSAVPGEHYQIRGSAVNSTSNVVITITNQAYHNNYLFKGRVCVLLVDLAGYDSRIAYYYYLVFVWSSQTYNFTLDFGVPSIFGNSLPGFNCMIGLTTFQDKPIQNQKVFSFIGTGTGLGLQIASLYSGPQSIYGIQVYCYVLCPPPTIILNQANSYSCEDCHSSLPMPNSIYYNTSTGTCLPCSNVLLNCAYCSSTTVCIRCNNLSWILAVDNSSCNTCANFIPNCAVCTDSNLCFACQINFYLTPNNSQCLPCTSFIINCSVCYNQSYCVQCSSIELFVSSNKSTCLLCSDYLPYCLSCVSEYVCTTCMNISFVVLKDDQCVFCIDVIPNCRYCSSTAICTQCVDKYYLSADQYYCLTCGDYIPSCGTCSNIYTCLSCLVGYAAVGGCTSTVGCIEVLYSTSMCIKCNSTYFVYNETSRGCDCKTGKLIGMYCVEKNQGCITAIPKGETFQCISCNISRQFYYDNVTKQCLCKDGYTLQNQKCVDLCGDGRVITNQCDDGNLVDGDGCSRFCVVQAFFVCSGGTSNSSSICTYLGKDIRIDLIDTRKSRGENQAVITFQIQPKLSQIQKFNLINYFVFNCNCGSSVQRWTYSDGLVKLYLNYLQDIQGAQSHITFNFDKSLVNHTSIDFDFTIRSNGTLLYVYNELEKQKITRYCFLGLAFIPILLIVAGSFFREMAGVELIQVLQTIYYLHYSIKQYSQTISSMQYLSPIALNNLFMQQEHQNYIGFKLYQKVDFSPAFAQMTIIGLSSFFLLTLLMKFVWQKVYFYLQVKRCKDEIKSSYKQEESRPKIKDYFHSIISFPYTLALLLPTYFVFNTYFVRNNTGYVYLSPLLRSVLIFVSICIVFINLSTEYLNRAFLSSVQRVEIGYKVRQFYASYYLTYQFYLLIALWVWMIKGWSFCLYVMIGGTVVMFMWQWRNKPYRLSLSNISILLNQFLLLCYEFYLFLKSYSLLKSTQTFDTIVNLIFIAFILLCTVLASVRVGIAICGSCKSKNDSNSSSKIDVKTKIKNQQSNIFARFESIKENILEKPIDRNPKFKKDRNLQVKNTNDEELNKLVKQMKSQFYRKKPPKDTQFNKPGFG